MKHIDSMMLWCLCALLCACGAESNTPVMLTPAVPLVASQDHGYTLPLYDRANDLDPALFGAVYDGVTDDAPAWQAAIDAARPGTRIVVTGISGIGPSGLLIRDHRALLIDGRGTGGIKVLGTSVLLASSMGPTVLLVLDSEEVTIHGLSIDGGLIPTNLLGLFRTTHSTISHNTTTGGGFWAAILTLGGIGNRVLHNVVRDTVASPARASRGFWIGNSNTIEGETDVLVLGNEAYDLHASCYALVTLRGHVESNLCQGTTGAGSGFAISSAPAPLNSTVSTNFLNNTARGTVWSGFQSDGNTINGVTGKARDIILQGNLSEDHGISGFYVVNADGWTLQGNVSRGNPRGLVLAEATDIILIDNIGF